jgi:hypothetical protein
MREAGRRAPRQGGQPGRAGMPVGAPASAAAPSSTAWWACSHSWARPWRLTDRCACPRRNSVGGRPAASPQVAAPSGHSRPQHSAEATRSLAGNAARRGHLKAYIARQRFRGSPWQLPSAPRRRS